MLTACALPGASGMGSFMTAMHPTQEVCASRGLTLDATSKQCVTPPASQGAATTGSLPSQTITTEQLSSPPVQQAPPQPKAEQRRPQQFQPQQAQPQQPPAQPQQSQEKAGLSVPIELDAAIRADSPQNSETAAVFAHFVRASGYRCDSISALAPRQGGFTLACNRSTFRYSIKDKDKDKDGRWIVTIE
jgi:hypothetical protein